MPRNNLIQIRRDTAANWTSTNPVLSSGEPGYETDTKKMKYGDGATAWNSLGYASGGADAKALADKYLGTWADSTTYPAGSILTYKGLQYTNIVQTTGAPSSTPGISYIASGGLYNSGGTNVSITLSSSLQVGDLISMVITTRSGVTSAKPTITFSGGSGGVWTLRNDSSANSTLTSGQYFWNFHYTKVVESGDIGGAITATTSNTNYGVACQYRAMRNVTLNAAYEQEETTSIVPVTASFTPSAGVSTIVHHVVYHPSASNTLPTSITASLSNNVTMIDNNASGIVIVSETETWASGTVTSKTFTPTPTQSSNNSGWTAFSLALSNAVVTTYPDTDSNWVVLPWSTRVRPPQYDVFDTGSGSWIKPAGATRVRFVFVGGGATGGGTGTYNNGGGGGGAFDFTMPASSIISTISYTVGAAANGSGVSAQGNPGNDTTVTINGIVYKAQGGGQGSASTWWAGGNCQVNGVTVASGGTSSGNPTSTRVAFGGGCGTNTSYPLAPGAAAGSQTSSGIIYMANGGVTPNGAGSNIGSASPGLDGDLTKGFFGSGGGSTSTSGAGGNGGKYGGGGGWTQYAGNGAGNGGSGGVCIITYFD